MGRDIAKKMGYPHGEEAYLAGLLHDVGRLALLATAPKEYAANFQARDDETLCTFEQDTLNIAHSEAGAWLVEHWKFDSFLADSVLYHHEPVWRLESTHPLIRIVLLAHLLCNHNLDDPAVKAAGRLCGLEDADLTLITNTADTQVSKAATFLGIDLSGFDPLSIPVVRTATAEPTRDSVQSQLAEEVRNRVLVSEASRLFSRQQGEAEWLKAVTQSARLLFDFEDAIVLRTNKTEETLMGVPVGEDRQRLGEFSIALGSGGVVAESARRRQLAFITGDEPSIRIFDEQLLRVLGSTSLVCVPLISGPRCLGVMLGGVASWQLPGLQQRENLLRWFGNQAASALGAVLRGEDQASQRAAAVAEDYKSVSRKVVHEVNNPLAIIKNYLSVLDSKLERHQPVAGELSILNDEIDRVGRIIKGLTNPKPTGYEGAAEINGVIRDVVRLFRDTDSVPPAVKIIVQIQDLASDVECRVDALKQILLNLIKNAIEAMPAGGEIQIVNSGHVSRDGQLYSELCVRDNGPGISPELLAQLFSPIQSTKGEGHQGVGLSIVHNLVINAQGLITCRSGGKGTSFEILLPVRRHNRQTADLVNSA